MLISCSHPPLLHKNLEFEGRRLHEQYGKNGLIRWAIAGRDIERLRQIRNQIGAADLNLLVVPGADAAAADKLAQSTRMVCATVAPAARYASEMVAACARHGTDYCDLSGELHWLRRMNERPAVKAALGMARMQPPAPPK